MGVIKRDIIVPGEKDILREIVMVKILGLGGSPRKGGNTDILLDHFLKGAGAAGASVRKVFLRDYAIHGCVGCEMCRKDRVCRRFQDGMQLLYPMIEESQGLVLGSPTYNYNVTPEVKAFIDRLYPIYNFNDNRPRGYTSQLAGQGRKAVVFAVCEQADSKDMGVTLPAMSGPLEALGYEVLREFPVLFSFEKGAVKQQPARLEEAVREGRRLAEESGG